MKKLGDSQKYGEVFDSPGASGGGYMIYVAEAGGWVKNPGYKSFTPAPVSAPVAGIDTPEFRNLLQDHRVEPDAHQKMERLIAHIDAWGQQQHKEGYREGRVSAHRAAQEQAARTTSDIAYESLSPERRKKFDADMLLLDQRMQDHRRSKERRQHEVPVEVERRVADARGTGVHQDRK